MPILPQNSNLTIQEAADFLGVSAKTLRRWEQQSLLTPARTIGNQRRYTQEQLLSFQKPQIISPARIATQSVAGGPAPLFPHLLPMQKTILAGIALTLALGGGAVGVAHITPLPPLPAKLSYLRGGGQQAGGDTVRGTEGVGSVLASETSIADFIFNVNVASKYAKDVEILGKLTAPNILYGLKAGTGVKITGDAQNPTISASGSASFASVKTGSTTLTATTSADLLTFTAGTGISLTADATTNKLTVSANGSDLNVSGWTDGGSIVSLTTAGDLVSIGAASGAAKLNINTDDNADLITASKSGDLKFRLTSAGIIDTGTWQATPITSAYLANTAVTAGSYGSSGATVPTFTVDAQGRLTAASSYTISGLTTSNLSATAGILNAQLANSSVTVTAGTGLSGGGAVSLGSAVTLSLPTVTTALGGTNITSYTTGDLLYASATDVLSKLGIGSADQVLAVSNGLPVWTSSVTGPGSGVFGYWQRAAGAIAPSYLTDDLLVGGASTASAKLSIISGSGNLTTAGTITLPNSNTLTGQSGNVQFSGGVSVGGGTTYYVNTSGNANFNTLNASTTSLAGTTVTSFTDSGSATISGALTLYGTPTIATTSKQTLTIGDANTGDIAFSQAIRATQGGTGQSAWTTGDILYASGTNTLAKLGIGSTNQSLIVSAGVPTWGTVSSSNWQRNSGTVAPLNIGDDLLIGGISTASAKFAVVSSTGVVTLPNTNTLTGVAGYLQLANGISVGGATTYYINNVGTANLNGLTAGTTTLGQVTMSQLTNNGSASISGALTLFTTPTIATTSKQTLTLGDSNTGNVVVTNNISAANLSGTNTGDQTITLSGDISGTGTGAITTTIGALKVTNAMLAGGITEAKGGTGQSTYTTGDILYSSATNTLAKLGIGGANQVLSVVAGIPGWVASGSVGTNYWNVSAGALFPLSSSVDLLIGGQATSSAKFQIFGPTGNATSAGNLTFNTAATIATTAKQTLTIGDANTGDIAFSQAIRPTQGGTGLSTVGSNNQVLIVSNGAPAWGSVPGSSCVDCILNDPGGTQTITPTVSTGTGLRVAQASGGTVDVFSVTNNGSTSKYFAIQSDGSATMSGNLTFDSAVTLATTKKQTLTIGDANTGNITLANPVTSTTFAGTITLPDTNTLTGVANYLRLSQGLSVGGADTYYINNLGNANFNQLTLPNTNTLTGVSGYTQASAGISVGGATTYYINNLGTANLNGLTAGTTVLGATTMNQLTNNGSASISGALTLFTTPTIATTSKQTLTIGDSNTGDIAFSQAIRATQGGTGQSTWITGDILYSSATDTLAKRSIGGTGQVLTVSAGLPAWVDATTLSNTYWQRNSGAVSPLNIGDDFLIGGISTASAKLSVISGSGNLTTAGTITLPNTNTLTGVSGYLQLANGISVGGGTTYYINTSGVANLAGTTVSALTNSGATTLTGALTAQSTASVSGGLVLYGTPTISTTNMQSLTLGDANTGNIVTSHNISATGTLTGLTGLTVASGIVSLPNGQIDNIELANSAVTITAGTGLTGGGAVSLGSAVTISTVQDIATTASPTFAGLTDTGSASVSGALILYGTPTIATTSMKSLTLGDANTGNIIINSPITTGTWNGSVLGAAYGGTGIANNAASTLTISGNYATTLTVTGITGVTLPTTGTLSTLAGVETLSNKTLTTPAVTTSLTTGSTTFALLNTTATTVNFAGAATALNIGAATGTTTINNAASVSGALTLYGTPTIATTAKQSLTIGDANTGNIVINGGALTSNVANSSTAIGFVLNTTAMSTQGSKLLSVQSSSTEKFYVDKDGNLYTAGTILSGNGMGMLMTNKSGGLVAQKALVIIDVSNDSAFTTTTTPYAKTAFGVVTGVGLGVTNDANGDGNCDANDICMIAVGGEVNVTLTNAATATKGDYIYTSATAGSGVSSSKLFDGLIGIVSNTATGASGYVKMIFKVQPQVTAAASIDKNSKHNEYWLYANSYAPVAEGTDVNANLLARGLMFDNLSDTTKTDSANTTVSIPTQFSNPYTLSPKPSAPFRAGLVGGQTYATSTTDNAGNTYLGSNTVNKTFYYDRTVGAGSSRPGDSSPAVQVELGIDPNWYNGVTLAVATSSAQFSQNTTIVKNPSLSTSYNGSLVKVTGTYTSNAKTIYITIKSPTTFDWTDYNGQAATGVTMTPGTAQVLGGTGVSVTFTNVNYNTGDVFKIASWFVEPASTTRGSKQQFPERSTIIATASSVDIIDADTQKLWMRFSKGSFYYLYTLTTPSSLTALNGNIYIGDSTGASGYGLIKVSLITDTQNTYFSSGGTYQLNTNVAQRNTTGVNSIVSPVTVVNPTINDVSAAVIPNQPTQNITVSGWGYITSAAASYVNETVNFPYKFNGTPTVTVSGNGYKATTAPTSLADCTSTTNRYSTWASSINQSNFTANHGFTDAADGNIGTGYYFCYSWTATGQVSPRQYVGAATDAGVTVINETDGTAYSYSDATDDDYNSVALTSSGRMYGLNETKAQLEKWRDIASNTAAETNGTPDKVWDEASTPALTATAPTINTNPSLSVTEKTSTINSINDTIYVGTNLGASVIQDNENWPTANDGSEEASGSVKYYTKDYISEEMVGDIRGMWPLSANGAISMSDASVKADTLTNNGTATAVTGVRGAGVSLNGTTQYLSCTDAACGGTSKLDPGTSSFTFGSWFKSNGVVATHSLILHKGGGGGGTGWSLGTDDSGLLKANIRDVATAVSSLSPSRVDDSLWHFGVGVINKSTNLLDLYLDGKLVTSTSISAVGSIDSTSDFDIGAYTNGGAAQWFFKGTVDEPFVTANALTAGQIKHMYEVGYRALQSHATTLGGGGADLNQQLGFISTGTNVVGDAKPDLNNQFMYVGTNSTTLGAVSKIDLNSDTNIKTYNSSANVPAGGALLIDEDVTSLAVGYNLEAVGSAASGVKTMGVDSYATATSGNFIGKTVTTAESFTQAYLWAQYTLDSSDASNTVTVSASNDGGSNYYTCNLTNTDTSQTPTEYEYFCQFNAAGSSLKTKFAFVRGSTKTNTYVTRYGIAWIGSDAIGGQAGGNGLYTNNNSAVADGSSITVTHNQNTNDAVTNAWYYDPQAAKWQSVDAELGKNHLIADTSLKGWWKFEEASGNAADQTSSAYTLTASGAITYSATGKVDGGKAFTLDGSSAYLTAAAKVTPTGAKSVGFWFKTTATGSQLIFTNNTNSTANSGLAIGTSTSTAGKIRVVASNGVSNYALESNADITDGKWHYFIHTWDGTTTAGAAKLYVDGILDNSATAGSTTDNTPTDNLRIGSNSGATPGSYFNGTLDEAFVYNRILSGEEVRDFYNYGARKYKVEQTSTNAVALYNFTGQTQNLRLDVITGGLGRNSGTVSLAPSAADINATANTNSIWINNTAAGGNLLKLQNAGTDVLSLATAGTMTLTGNFLPGTDNTYSLGASSSARFKDLFLGPASLHLQSKSTDTGYPALGLDYALGINTAGSLGVSLNGTTNPLMTITQGGSVGIGTVSPELATHIVGALGFPATTGTAQTGVLRLQGTGSNGVLDFSVNGGSGASLQVTARTDLTQNYVLSLNPNGGNVGIGTTNPTNALDVNGGFRVLGATGGTAVGAGAEISYTGGTAYYQAYNRAGSAWLPVAMDGLTVKLRNSGVDAVTITGGNVGIGTTAPVALLSLGAGNAQPLPTNTKLWVAGAGGAQGSTMQSRISLGVDSNLDYGAFIGAVNIDGTGGGMALALGDRGAGADHVAMYLRNGNVGIGTTAPATKLAVAGAISLLSGNSLNFNNTVDDYAASISNAAGTGSSKLGFFTGATERLTILHAGNVGIGCTDPDHLLELGGTGTGCNTGTGSWIAAGSTAFTANSSQQWKENIATFNVPDILTRFQNTKPRTFDWKAEYNNTADRTNNLGFIAEEFYPVLERGDNQHVNGQDIMIANWLATQALIDKVASMSAELATLQIQNNPAASLSAELWQYATESGKLITAFPVQTSDLTVTGKLTVGLMSFDDLESSISSLTGVITIKGDLAVTGKIRVLGDSIGESVIASGSAFLIVNTTAVSSASAVFVTPNIVLDSPLSVTQSSPGASFKVEIPRSIDRDIPFKWWIIN